jgi:hypothetical protein
VQSLSPPQTSGPRPPKYLQAYLKLAVKTTWGQKKKITEHFVKLFFELFFNQIFFLVIFFTNFFYENAERSDAFGEWYKSTFNYHPILGSIRLYRQAKQVLLHRGVVWLAQAREHCADGDQHPQEEVERSPDPAKPRTSKWCSHHSSLKNIWKIMHLHGSRLRE